MNISGVYAIWCNGNQKIYIGSSVDILKRINQHKRELRTGKHHNPILQRSWNKLWLGKKHSEETKAKMRTTQARKREEREAQKCAS